ncbi:MAG: hypothetical protein U1A77_15495 [Pirellulales bacterium]
MSSKNSANKGIRSLALISLLVGVGWLVVFPAVARLGPIRRHIERLEAARIDPSAMYYTELEMIGDVRQSLADFHREHPQALWSGEMSANTLESSNAPLVVETDEQRRAIVP